MSLSSLPMVNNNSHNNKLFYSSLREIKAVVRSHNEEHNNSKSWTTRTYTLLDIRPLSLNLHTLLLSYSKPKIIWNNAFSVSDQNVKTLKLRIKIIRLTHPQPSLRNIVLIYQVNMVCLTSIETTRLIRDWEKGGGGVTEITLRYNI